MKHSSGVGFLRIDLLGGTLDIWPIYLNLENATTIALAMDLEQRANIQDIREKIVHIISHDFKSEVKLKFDELNKKTDFLLIQKIISLFSFQNNQHFGIQVELSSDVPPKSGLGGSSVLAMALYQALCSHFNQTFEIQKAIRQLKDIESSIINCPAGYQDYIPAVTGGIVAITPKIDELQIHQLYTDEANVFLQNHCTLIDSKISHDSGVPNWEVYKRFFDGEKQVVSTFHTIAKLSHEAHNSLSNNRLDEFLVKVSLEGEIRKNLFPGIYTDSMNNLFRELKNEIPHLGMRICGAGGGGHFTLHHKPDDKSKIEKAVNKANMEIRSYTIKGPK